MTHTEGIGMLANAIIAQAEITQDILEVLKMQTEAIEILEKRIKKLEKRK